jgi:hypothetical protein
MESRSAIAGSSPRKLSSFALGLLALLAAVGAAAQGGVILTHVHGLAYSPDGRRLMIPSHHGLAIYESGKWAKAPGPQHDYMGFSATSTSLYSSGHPAPNSGLVNPFGLIRSRDGGKTWEKLGLEGETDFHLLATSWNTNALYVWNPAPSSLIPRAGLHYTLNDGKTWTAVAGAGLSGELRALAVHPNEVRTVAVATAEGVFISHDSGASFTPVASDGEAFSAYFDLDGARLWYGSFDSAARLSVVAIAGGRPVAIKLPSLGQDAVSYIAQNPRTRSEYAIASFRRSVYISKDKGNTWMQAARHGLGK